MKITRIVAWRVELPLHETTYKWSGGKSVTVFDSTIVRVETDTGLAGHGEVCPLGPFYLPAYADGVRAGLSKASLRLARGQPSVRGVQRLENGAPRHGVPRSRRRQLARSGDQHKTSGGKPGATRDS